MQPLPLHAAACAIERMNQKAFGKSKTCECRAVESKSQNITGSINPCEWRRKKISKFNGQESWLRMRGRTCFHRATWCCQSSCVIALHSHRTFWCNGLQVCKNPRHSKKRKMTNHLKTADKNWLTWIDELALASWSHNGGCVSRHFMTTPCWVLVLICNT